MLLLVATLLQGLLLNTLVLALDRNLHLRRLLADHKCLIVINDLDLRSLLAKSVQLKQRKLLAVGHQLSDLLANDQADASSLVNTVVDIHPELSSVVLLDYDRHSVLSAGTTRGGSHLELLEMWHPTLLNSSETPIYSLEPDCTQRQWHSWTVVLVWPVSSVGTVFIAPNRLLLLHVTAGLLDLDVCDSANLTACNAVFSRCESITGIGLRLDGYHCCCVHSSVCIDSATMESSHTNWSSYADLCKSLKSAGINYSLRTVFLVVNIVCVLLSVIMVFVVIKQRRAQVGHNSLHLHSYIQQYNARGWALMELLFIGATLLYAIILVEWVFPPRSWTCYLAVWLRQVGFATFYGAVVLKIYRNMQEFRVRKAHRVYVKEKDLLKYMGCLITLTISSLIAWTLGAVQMSSFRETVFPFVAGHSCHLPLWSAVWHMYELLFLFYAVRMCYRTRNSTWTERWQFTVVVCLELLVTIVSNLIRFFTRHLAHPDIAFSVSFVQVHFTVTISILLIVMSKSYLMSKDGHDQRAMATSGNSGRAHPSLAKLRDNLVNGTIDFSEVPISDMNSDDIMAELKRIYTQLRMYKLKSIYDENPHISKRKGWKKSGDKSNRIRIISASSTSTSAKMNRADEDEKNSMIVVEEERMTDLTVESAHAPLSQLGSDGQVQHEQSVRV